MLTLAVVCALFAAILGVLVYMARTVKPRAGKSSRRSVWELVNLSFEAEAGPEPSEPPPGGGDST